MGEEGGDQEERDVKTVEMLRSRRKTPLEKDIYYFTKAKYFLLHIIGYLSVIS